MEHSPKIDFYKKREFSDTLNSTFMFIRENGWPYLKVQLLIAGPILLILYIFTSKYQMSFLGMTERMQEDGFLGEILNLYGIAFLSTVVTGSIIPTLSYGYLKAYEHNRPEDITVAKVTQGFGKRYFSMLGFIIIALILVLFSSLFLILPGIYMFTVLSLGFAIVAFEDANPFTAIGRCFNVIKDHFFNTLLLVVVVGLIAYVVSGLFSIPQAIMFFIWSFSSLQEGTVNTAEMPAYMQALSVVFSVFQTFGTIVAYSLVYIALAYQYSNLIERRESRGLMSRIGSIDQEQQEDEDEVY